MENYLLQNNSDRLIKFLSRILEGAGKDMLLCDYKAFNRHFASLFNKRAENISRDGFCFWQDENEYIICLNEKLEHEYKLYVMAHEMAHVFFRHPENLDTSNADTEEWDSNLFAAIMMFVLNGALPIMERYEKGAAVLA